MTNKPGRKIKILNKLRDELIFGRTRLGDEKGMGARGLCVSLRHWNAKAAVDIFNKI